MSGTTARTTARLMTVLSLVLVAAGSGTRTASAASPTVVISQVYGGGGNTGATLRHDFIELFNRGERAVDIGGWSVQYASSGGTRWQTTPLEGTLRPGQYFLIRQPGGGGGTQGLPQPDARGTIALSATSGTVALVATTEPLTCSGPCAAAPGVKDLLGYGNVTRFEGSGPAPTLSNTEAARRLAGGCADADDNAGDFVVRAPRPRNTASPLAPCANRADVQLEMTVSRGVVETGTRFRFELTVTNAGPSTATRLRVTETLPEELVFEAAQPADSCTRSGRTVTCALGSLPPGESRRLVLYVSGIRAGEITNTASAVASEPDATPPAASVTISVEGPDCDIVGTPGADVLSGSDGGDVICALSGDDRIAGGHGADLLLAAGGSDRGQGGSGDDVLDGAAGVDTLVGGGGADELRGGEAGDALDARDGVSGNDVIHGGGGTDACEADAGDTLTACP